MMRRKELHPLSLNRVFKVTPAGPRNTKSMRQCPQRSCPIRFLALFVVSAVGAKTALAGRCPMAERVQLPQPYPASFITRLDFGRFVRPSAFAQPGAIEGERRFARRRRVLFVPQRDDDAALPGESYLVERERYQGSHRALRRNSRPHTSPHGSTPLEGKAGEILSLRPGGPSARRSLRRPHDADDAPHGACVICVIAG
jgi:hypothetical protein